MLAWIAPLWAAEGMWLPEQVRGMQAELSAAGIEIPAEKLGDPLGDPLGAIVHVGDFCSGSLVSGEGLVLTNHHCVWDFLQHNTTKEHNLLQDGFVASSQAEERWGGPSAELYIVERNEDVTAQILAKVRHGTDDASRGRAIALASATLVATCERQQDRRCEISEEYGGRSYRLLTHRVIQDVRLVYAPPMTVGSFGGDTDNFEWPRHDGDFAVLRAYVAPDGSSRSYNQENVPYQPPHHLRVQPAGISPGAPVWIAGFPGSTQRYDLYTELNFLATTAYPWRVQTLLEGERILKEEAEKSAEGAAKVGAHQQELANSRKYYQGVLDNVAGSPLLQRKGEEEAALKAWIQQDPARAAYYGPGLAELEAIIAADQASWKRDFLLTRASYWPDMLGFARTVVHYVHEQKKPDLQREEGFKLRDREQLLGELASLSTSLHLPADRRFFDLVWTLNQQLPAAERVAPLAALDSAAIEKIYADTRLIEESYRNSLMALPLAKLKKVEDPWIQLALALEPLEQEVLDRAEAHDGANARLRPLWMDAFLSFRKGKAYPDANNTLRLSFGTVQGYTVRDAVEYTPQTTVRGMLAKVDSGNYPPPPPSILSIARNAPKSPYADPALGDVPLCFLTDLDSTGGNSGSATLNAKGELVGLLFDGNYESMAADWLFDPATTRSIHVDIRYILLLLDGQEQSRWIREELLR